MSEELETPQEPETSKSWIGPPSYDNWRAFLDGDPSIAAFEFPLYSDANFTGQVEGSLGPYSFFNLVAFEQLDRLVRAAVVVRFELHMKFETPKMNKTDVARYHGGDTDDEIAALASLILGCRFFAGGETRRFDIGGSPRGQPVAWHQRSEPTLHFDVRRMRVRSAAGTHSLMVLEELAKFPKISPAAAIAVVRSARLYQDAIWLAESEPHLAWLLLVSAVETAANFWSSAQDLPIERMRASKPKLVDLLERAGGVELAESVAELIADSLGSTKKFVSFIMNHIPPAPAIRPAEWGQASWEKEKLTTALRTIYGHRSKALHDGIAFPAPMCESPFKHETWNAVAEKPSFIAASKSGGIWIAEDTPMYLHTFEYIARNCLLSWWRNLAERPANSA